MTHHYYLLWLANRNTIWLVGYQIWEERSLRVFCSRVLRRLFEPKKDEVTRDWRKVHNEELGDLWSSPTFVRVNKSRRMRWARHVARLGERRCIDRVLVGKTEGKRPLGRIKCKGDNNIKMDLLEVNWGASTGLIWLSTGTGGGHL